MLRLTDVEDLEEVRRARQRTKKRCGEKLFRSSKFRQKWPALPERRREMSRRSVPAVRASPKLSSSEGPLLDRSDNQRDLGGVFLAEA